MMCGRLSGTDRGIPCEHFVDLFTLLGLAAAGACRACGRGERAGSRPADVGINQSFLQTSDSGLVSDDAFFSARVFFDNVGDFTAGTLTVPGPRRTPEHSCTPV